MRLTPLQDACLRAVQDLTVSLGRAPSVREVGARMGGKSPGTVHFAVKCLREKGLLAKPAAWFGGSLVEAGPGAQRALAKASRKEAEGWVALGERNGLLRAADLVKT